MGKQRMSMRLLGTVSVLGLTMNAGAQAQDLPLDLQDEGFLGTVELGQGKREVQTATATPQTVITQEELDRLILRKLVVSCEGFNDRLRKSLMRSHQAIHHRQGHLHALRVVVVVLRHHVSLGLID